MILSYQLYEIFSVLQFYCNKIYIYIYICIIFERSQIIFYFGSEDLQGTPADDRHLLKHVALK